MWEKTAEELKEKCYEKALELFKECDNLNRMAHGFAKETRTVDIHYWTEDEKKFLGATVNRFAKYWLKNYLTSQCVDCVIHWWNVHGIDFDFKVIMTEEYVKVIAWRPKLD